MPAEPKNPDRYIIITGNPVDGHDYFGPFNDHDAAALYAVNNFHGTEWWIAKINDK